MNPSTKILMLCIVLMLAAIPAVHAGEITIPNTFEAGTPAVAGEVNVNFTVVETAVADNDSRIAVLESALAELETTIAAQAGTIAAQADTITVQISTIAALQSRLTTVQSREVMALDDYFAVDETGDPRGTRVRLSGVNLQIVNGLGSSATQNGLGNFIIGYDEAKGYCTMLRTLRDQEACESRGLTWIEPDKTGSHYLVTGQRNNYTRYGGMVGGYKNNATAPYSTVIGGNFNFACGPYSSIRTGNESTACGSSSSVSTGFLNEANGDYSSVSSGSWNNANGDYSIVSGGTTNEANGNYSSVSGGVRRTALGLYDWVAGSLMEYF
ncbi:MAG: hypothetical protein HKM93_00795 [Desulfobacteraceae bacterium]|nr:hypothetical protein [Desulfobacteraceae bacterium]